MEDGSVGEEMEMEDRSVGEAEDEKGVGMMAAMNQTVNGMTTG